ncbi:MAG TPA: hypothetical protein VFX60_03055 [Micromonospora sp.]|nr:hypothetical protein [Micromonospora sp.]
MYPSTSPEAGRDPWSEEARTRPAGRAPSGAPSRGASPRGAPRAETSRSTRQYPGPGDGADPTPGTDEMPIRRLLSLSIAGFAALLGVGLVFGAQTAGPGTRLPFALIVFGVQVLFILAWTMALRPPALWVIAVVSVAVAGAADAAAVGPEIAALAPLGYVLACGFVAAVIAQLVRRKDRERVTESLGSTLLIMVGVVAFATLIVLGRLPIGGTQAIFVALTAAGVALTVAHLTDAVLPRPRLAPQVPRGVFGVVLGAMTGTLVSAIIGSYVVAFSPASGAVIGFVTAGAAVLVDLAADYSEAGRQMAGEPPTMWIARHMRGPLGGFALAAPLSYAVSVLLM